MPTPAILISVRVIASCAGVLDRMSDGMSFSALRAPV
jgi:hypothetical protein